ncbi:MULTISPECIES: hypothetical protein [Streptomyces]|uniref:hypothetical protein n=1 Tax=Streptomyces TaxID=1883 RepID=UPI0028B12607|nr:hypothetical protein [Streptomyces parvus]
MGFEVARLRVVEDAEDVRGGRVVLGTFGASGPRAGSGAEAAGRTGDPCEVSGP